LTDQDEDVLIIYRFVLPDGSAEQFVTEVTPSIDTGASVTDEIPEWTRLEFEQCRHCPLAATESPVCPVANALAPVVGRFETLVSHDELQLEVVQQDRSLRQTVSTQQALSSLLGLLIATSGCPHTAFLRPMARFHQPLAGELETLYRSASMYMLGQYFRAVAGEPADLEMRGLSDLYAALHEVNDGVVRRLRAASRTDSALNAVVILDLYTLLLPDALEDSLHEIAPYFSAFVAHKRLN